MHNPRITVFFLPITFIIKLLSNTKIKIPKFGTVEINSIDEMLFPGKEACIKGIKEEIVGPEARIKEIDKSDALNNKLFLVIGEQRGCSGSARKTSDERGVPVMKGLVRFRWTDYGCRSKHSRKLHGRERADTTCPTQFMSMRRAR